VLELVLRRPTAARLPAAPGEAQLALAGLRVTEMLADDSNHRAQLMDALAGPAAAALAAPAPEFESSWCGGAARDYLSRQGIRLLNWPCGGCAGGACARVRVVLVRM
jgi:hypothetical protein